jgi:hypothetical protein
MTVDSLRADCATEHLALIGEAVSWLNKQWIPMESDTVYIEEEVSANWRYHLHPKKALLTPGTRGTQSVVQLSSLASLQEVLGQSHANL